MRGGNNQGNYRNPCLTMHQPWASLLVYGIKRIEGRSWPSPIRGRLWIHAAGKVPDEDTIKAMEEFYRQIYAVNGITDIKFPQHYPVSRLIGCVDVVGCIKCEEVANWEALPDGARLEGMTDFCWLCEQPQKLLIPFEMRGFQGVYNLEKRIYDSAVRGLTPVKGPLPVKFPLPDPTDRFSLKPGSISSQFRNSKTSTVMTSSSVSAAVAGARAVATQFSKKPQNIQTNQSGVGTSVSESRMSREPPNEGGSRSGPSVGKSQGKSTEEDRSPPVNVNEELNNWPLLSSVVHRRNDVKRGGSNSNNETSFASSRQQYGSGAPKIFSAALRDLKRT